MKSHFILLAVLFAAGVSGQQSAVDPPFEKVDLIDSRLSQIDRELAQLLQRREHLAGIDRRLIQAGIHLRVLTRSLFREAQSAADSQIQAELALTADTLLSRLLQIESALNTIPALLDRRNRLLMNYPQSGGKEALSKLGRRIAVLPRLNRFLAAPLPEEWTLEATQAYLARMVKVLQPLVENGVKDHRARPIGPVSGPGSPLPGVPKVSAPNVKRDLDQLERANLPIQVKKAGLGALISAAKRVPPEKMAHRKSDYLRIRKALQAMSILSRSGLADPEGGFFNNRQKLDRLMHQNLILSREARVRESALTVLDSVSRIGDLYSRLIKMEILDRQRRSIRSRIFLVLMDLADPLKRESARKRIKTIETVLTDVAQCDERYKRLEIPRSFQRAADSLRQRYRMVRFQSIEALSEDKHLDVSKEKEIIFSIGRVMEEMDWAAKLPDAVKEFNARKPRFAEYVRPLIKQLLSGLGDSDPVRRMRTRHRLQHIIEGYRSVRNYGKLKTRLGSSLVKVWIDSETAEKIDQYTQTTIQNMIDAWAQHWERRLSVRIKHPSKRVPYALPLKETPKQIVDPSFTKLKQTVRVLELFRSLLDYDKTEPPSGVGSVPEGGSLSSVRLNRWWAWQLDLANFNRLRRHISSESLLMADVLAHNKSVNGSRLAQAEQLARMVEIVNLVIKRYARRLPGGKESLDTALADLSQPPDPAWDRIESRARRCCWELNQAANALRLGFPDYARRHLDVAMRNVP